MGAEGRVIGEKEEKNRREIKEDHEEQASLVRKGH